MLCFLFVSLKVLSAQTTSGVISGQVVDTQGASVPDAHITLTEQSTSATMGEATDKHGDFIFPVVKPGTYTVTVTKAGFEKVAKQGVTVLAADRVAVGVFTLKVGAVSTVVTVTASVTPVQTTSSERSTEITSQQMEGLLSLGRDFTSLLRILPGSTYEGNGNAMLGSASVGSFNGVSSNFNSINTDGVSSNTRNVGTVEGPLNMDAIQEVKVLDANYQAEYGKVAGSIIDVVSKSGSRDYHGTVTYYLRNEDMNANAYFNNRTGAPRARYRYNTVNASIGGPIFGPGRFHSLRDKLFFFFSEDYEPNSTPNALRYYTMPTALERTGDFSQSINSAGTLYTVLDPLTGTPFPENVVPGNRINSAMQAIQGILPLPNFTNRAISNGNYNYVLSDSTNAPARQESLRLDYNPSERLHLYFRGSDLHNNATGRTEPGISASWMNGQVSYNTRAPSLALNATYIFNPHIVNELSLGAGLWYENNVASQSTINQFSKSAQNIGLGQLYPANNPLDLINGMSYGVIPNAPSLSYDGRFPMQDFVLDLSISDGLSYVHGNHNLKFGIYADDAYYQQPHHSGNASFAGSFVFSGANTSNPYNTGYAFAEQLMGYFDTYTESTARLNYDAVSSTLEWYAQDSWKVTKKLTLEYGLRFTADIPGSLQNGVGSSLFLNEYDASTTPALYYPILANGKRMTEDPTTGNIYPLSYEDHFVPNSGNPASGSLEANSSNFPGIFVSKGVLLSPRLGFAYDMFGDGKTAIRAGVGMFRSPRTWQGNIGNLTFNPPSIFYPVQYYGSVADFTNAQGIVSPSSTTVFQRNSTLPRNINLTLGIQQDLGHQVVMDLAYVGVIGRYNPYTVNLNKVPYGAEFQPANQDKTSGTPLPDDYFRPYPGYSSINYNGWGDNTNYHSLQLQVNRRFSNGLQFGGAYTLSKLLDDNKSLTYLPVSVTYGLNSSDRPQRLVVNYLYDLPSIPRGFSNVVTRLLLNNWETSGIATFSSGAPAKVSYSTTNGENVTGGGDGSTVVVTGNVQLPRGSRTFNRYFNTSVFQVPIAGNATRPGQIGNGWLPVLFGPGINDWDMAVIKKIPIREHTSLQIRAEAYNAFNHTQFSGVNTSAIFNPTTGAQTNTAFGQLNAARTPRIMQVAARFQF